MKSRDRYPKFKKGPNGEKLCRGCGKLVPKGRQTWCSSQCFHERCPQMVISAVRRRDKGVCAMCGRDTVYLHNAYHRFMNRAFAAMGYSYFLSDWAMFTGNEASRRVRDAARKAGWPVGGHNRWWEADHIVPHSEGGEFVLDNMRTLCVPCHKKRTKHWHKTRKEKQQLTFDAA